MAIFDAFGRLLKQNQYSAVTVQDIIDEANIGRSTFYAHFETKDALLQALCAELFSHIVSGVTEHYQHCAYQPGQMPDSVFLHILLHLLENDMHILTLLSCESNEIFLRYFKESLEGLIRTRVLPENRACTLPEDFLVNHISGSFVDMVRWWLQTGRRQTPEELDLYFRTAIAPLLY